MILLLSSFLDLTCSFYACDAVLWFKHVVIWVMFLVCWVKHVVLWQCGSYFLGLEGTDGRNLGIPCRHVGLSIWPSVFSDFWALTRPI